MTPMPVQSHVLSSKAAQAVLYRQFTMQLMPMYRQRQRSAGKPTKPYPFLNQDLSESLSTVKENRGLANKVYQAQTQLNSF